MAKAVHSKVPAFYACMRLLRKNSQPAIARMKRARQRRNAFYKRQAQERLLFAFFMSITVLSMHWSAVRAVWAKERSTYWWERIVNSAFTLNDWLENFRMSHNTLVYLCNELRQTVEKENTVMRKAIPVEQRVALTYSVAVGNNSRLPDHWALVRSFQGSCVRCGKGGVLCHSAGTATKVY